MPVLPFNVLVVTACEHKTVYAKLSRSQPRLFRTSDRTICHWTVCHFPAWRTERPVYIDIYISASLHLYCHYEADQLMSIKHKRLYTAVSAHPVLRSKRIFAVQVLRMGHTVYQLYKDSQQYLYSNVLSQRCVSDSRPVYTITHQEEGYTCQCITQNSLVKSQISLVPCYSTYTSVASVPPDHGTGCQQNSSWCVPWKRSCSRLLTVGSSRIAL